MKQKILIISLLTIFFAMPGVLAQEDSCEFVVDARNTTELVDMIGVLDERLTECPLELPRSASWLLGNGQTIITIDRGEANDTVFGIVQEKGSIVSIAQNPADESCTQRVTIAESFVDTILSEDDRASGVAEVFEQDGFVIEGCTRMRQAANAIITRVIGFFV